MVIVLLNGLRILQFVLGAAMLVYWYPCLWRILLGIPEEGDAGRATWLPFAFSSLLYGLSTLTPRMAAADRSKLALAAHLCMVLTMMFAIYIRGREMPGFQLRKVMAVHIALLFGCIAVAAYAA